MVADVTRTAVLCVVALLPTVHLAAGVSVEGSLIRQYETEPGRAVEGTIDVQNTGFDSQEVRFYQTDYHFTAEGASVFGDPGGTERSNARWIQLSPTRVTVAPSGKTSLHYTIRVPADTLLAGTYWSVIMVEPLAPRAVLPEADPTKVTVAIKEVVRYAIQIITHIRDTGRREVRFAQVRLAPADVGQSLAVDMENTGERLMSGALWAELYDSRGHYAGKFEGGRHGLYPGTSARFNVDLSNLDAQTYRALLVFDCGGDDVFGLRATLTLGK
jgi:hypothetical protein